MLSLSEHAPADGEGDRFAERLRTRGRLAPRPRRFLQATTEPVDRATLQQLPAMSSAEGDTSHDNALEMV